MEAHPVIRYGADPDWPPFSKAGPRGTLDGIDLLMLNEIQPHLRSKFVYVPSSSWTAAVENYHEGKIDILLGTAKTKEREADFIFTKPYFEFPVAIVSRIESPFLTTLEQLRFMRVAGARNHVTTNTLRRIYPEINLVEVETSADCLRLVAEGKADATVGNLVALSYQIGELDINSLKVSGLLENRYGLCYAIRKDWPELVSILDQTLDHIPQTRREQFIDTITPDLKRVVQRAEWRRRSEWSSLLGLGFACALGWLAFSFFRQNRRRQQREQEFRLQQEKLEQMVEDRTAELTSVNYDLQNEVRERTRAEEVLRKSEEKFARLFNSLPDGSLVSTVDTGIILDVNPAFCQCTGYSMEELIGRTSLELGFWINPDDRRRIMDAIKQSEDTVNWEADFRRRDGVIIPVEFSSRIVEMDGRKCMIGVARELTEIRKAEAERLELEDQLHRAQKMEALGRLTGGVAHDFNNLLQVIQGNVLMLKEAEDDIERELFLDGLVEAADRAAALTRQLLSFSRGQPLRKELLELDPLLQGEIRMIQRVLPDQIETVYDCHGTPPVIEGDRTQIGQVIMNLCVNARDAMPHGGTLRIEVDSVPAEEVILSNYKSRLNKNLARIRISDTGTGMDEKTKAHIFEPFFTTKEQDRGTGLGLAVVYGVVQKHGGQIMVASELGVGTTFTIYFPMRNAVSAKLTSAS